MVKKVTIYIYIYIHTHIFSEWDVTVEHRFFAGAFRLQFHQKSEDFGPQPLRSQWNLTLKIKGCLASKISGPQGWVGLMMTSLLLKPIEVSTFGRFLRPLQCDTSWEAGVAVETARLEKMIIYKEKTTLMTANYHGIL